MTATADDDGLHLPPDLTGSFDVLFDDEPIWTIVRSPRAAAEGAPVRWPDAMRPYLEGTARVRLRSEDTDVDLGEVSFGSGAGSGPSGTERVAFVDKRGLPIVIDKWGIVQRPFSTRGGSVVEALVDKTEEVIAILREDCGIETWMSFGTLLGAARSGGVIGHDSDVDLLYLSEHECPALINLEAYRIRRALVRRGLRAVFKSGSFVTVVFDAPDGAPLGIDVYACFYVGDLLHETATVRAPIPRDAVLPLGTLTFEGRELPAPARPDVLLQASYGPNWRVPDPSFRHRPGPEITDRFDAWFGSVMVHRRAWELWWHQHQDAQPVSDLMTRVLADLPAGSRVVDVGCGNGSDAEHAARAGHEVLGVDYARGCFRESAARVRADDLAARFQRMNLYDARDVRTLAALQRRLHPGPVHLVARHLLDALGPRGVENFWDFVDMMRRGGGSLHLEFDEHWRSRAPLRRLRNQRRPWEPGAFGMGRFGGSEGPARHPVSRQEVLDRLRKAGARVDREEVVEVVEQGEDGPTRRRWQVVAQW